MLVGGADHELVRLEAVIADDEADGLPVPHLQRLQREGVVGRDDLDRARDPGGITGLAATHGMAGAVRRRGPGDRQGPCADE